MLTLTFGVWTSHWPVSPQTNDRKIGAWKEENGAEKSVPQKNEEHGRRE
jgi:hypothetical protein